MEKTNNNKLQKLRAFFASETFKALLPFIGLVVIVVGMNMLTGGKILTPKRIKLLMSQVYYPMIVATGVFFVMTLGSISFTEGSTLGVASIVISMLSFYSIPLAILGGVLTGAAIGAINGFFHVKFKLQSFIVTICTMYLFRGVCAYLTTETAIPASAAIKALDQNWIKITVTLIVLAVADFGGDLHRLRQSREGEPGHILCQKGVGEQSVIGTQGDGVAEHIFPADIDRCAHGKAQTFSLAQGVAHGTPVL